MANKGEQDTRIAEIVSTHRQTVWRIKKRYIEEVLESALKDKSRPGQPKKYEITHETEIAALALLHYQKVEKNGHNSFFRKN